MHAVQYTGHGGTDAVTGDEVPDPTVGRDEAFVEDRAGAPTHLDRRTRRGLPDGVYDG